MLFPLAHLRVFDGVPIYAAEFPLLIALLFTLKQLNFERLCLLWREMKVFFIMSALFVGGAILTFWWQELPFYSLGLFKSFILLPVLCAWLILSLRPKEAEQQWLLAAWLLGVSATALAALIAFLSGWITYDGRLASLYLSPNHLAMLVAPGVLLAFFFFDQATGRFWRRLLFGVIMSVSLALFLTRSYASIGALGIAWLLVYHRVLGMWIHRYRWVFFGLIALISVFIFSEISSEKFHNLISGDGRSSLDSRLMIWQAALHIGQTSFPLGIGIGQFQRAYLEAQPLFPPYLEWAVPEPHNLILSWYLATGLIGCGTVLSLVVATLRSLRSKLGSENIASQQKNLTRLYLALALWWLVVGLIDTPYFKNDLTLGFWVVLALAWVSLYSSGRPHTRA